MHFLRIPNADADQTFLPPPPGPSPSGKGVPGKESPVKYRANRTEQLHILPWGCLRAQALIGSNSL